MADNYLCGRCRKIPFASLFVTPRRDVTLSTLGELRCQKACRFCDLLKHTLATHYGSEYMEKKANENSEMVLYVGQSPVDPRSDWNELYAEKRSGTFYLELHARGPKGGSLERVAKKTDDEFNESWFMPKIQLLRQHTSDSAVVYGKEVLPDVIDWDYIRGWIKICEETHIRRDTVDLSSIPMLTIDVKDKCIVPMPRGPVRYIALSYMWGKDQPVKLKQGTYSLLTTPGAFGKAKGLALSRTIKDAICATELLGCRYLWVDALCVIQDDPAHLRANMSAMDRVYLGAWLTIVAAAGENADGGLPGVYPDLPRAVTQMKVDIPQKNGSITVGNMLDSAKAELNFSTWDTRGWTYQERVLSHRLLSFTHSQVYFYCDSGCSCREDMYPIFSPGDEGARDFFNAGYELSFEYDDLFTLYATATARYTHRQLTQQTDKVNAFQGVLNHLSGPFGGLFFFGLPSTVFDVGLLWEPAGPCRRVCGEFPSWSWAGWTGPVRYAMKDSMANLCECTVSAATMETSNGLRLCAKSDAFSPSPVSLDEVKWSRCFDEDTLELYYTTKNTFLAGYRYPRPIVPLNQSSGGHTSIKKAFTDPILRIRGYVAALFVSDKHSSAGALSLSTCSEGIHTYCHLQLLSPSNQIVGSVIVNGDNVSDISGKNHRFLALSRSTLRRMDDDPSWDLKTRKFRHWTNPGSGAPGDENESSESDEDIAAMWSDMRARKEFFDTEVFNPRVFWPVLNILLLSEKKKDGVAERVGIGKVHIDGFMPLAAEEDVLLG